MHRIGIDCTQFYKGRVGGFESYLHNLLEGIAQTKPVDTAITCFVLSSQLPHFERFRQHFKIQSIRLCPYPLRALWQHFWLPMLSARYDAILFPANFRSFVLLCRSVTVVHDIQCITIPSHYSLSKRTYRSMALRRSLSASDDVICISEFTAGQVRDAFGCDRVQAIWNPIAVEPFEKHAVPACQAPVPQEDYLLVASSLGKNKNIPALLRAAESLREEEAPTIVFIGNYSKEHFPSHQASKKIVVLGYVDRAVRDAIFYGCRAVLCPSFYEGFGMPYVEGVLCKKPIIACDILPAREILGQDATYIAAPFGPEQIRDGIVRFLNSDSLAPSEDQRQRLMAKTDPRRVAQGYLDVLRKMVA